MVDFVGPSGGFESEPQFPSDSRNSVERIFSMAQVKTDIVRSVRSSRIEEARWVLNEKLAPRVLSKAPETSIFEAFIDLCSIVVPKAVRDAKLPKFLELDRDDLNDICNTLAIGNWRELKFTLTHIAERISWAA